MSLVDKFFRIFNKPSKIDATQKDDIELTNKKEQPLADVARATTGYSSTLGVRSIVFPNENCNVDVWHVKSPIRRGNIDWIVEDNSDRMMGGMLRDHRPKWST